MGKLQIYSFIFGISVMILLVTGSMADVSKGVISVTSNPEGAEIYLTHSLVPEEQLNANNSFGLTPREFFVDPGDYRLYLKKYGYITWISDQFHVGPGQSIPPFKPDLSIQTSQYGALHIDSNPHGANVTLIRIKGDLNTYVYGKTPLSLESLPEGNYDYIIGNVTGYFDEAGSVTITKGNVTEIYKPLIPKPDSAKVTFRSDPPNAKIVLIGGTQNGANMTLVNEVKNIIANFNGTPEDAVNTTTELLQSQQNLPARAICGVIGSTPTEMNLNAGYYIYRYYLPGYSMEGGVGDFSVSVGKDMNVSKEMLPNQQYVQVYFESNVDDMPRPDVGSPGIDEAYVDHPAKSGANVYANGIYLGNTPGWINLPSSNGYANNNIVNVTFDKLPMFAPKNITVDTTLFTGRPSKWGKVIHLDLMDYYLTTKTDGNSKIDPHSGPNGEPIEVAAGQTQTFNLTGIGPEWLVGNLTVTREGHNPVNFTYNQSSAVYNLSMILENATLDLTSVKKQVAVTAKVSKGGHVNDEGVKYYDYGTESVIYNFTPESGYEFKELWEDGDKNYKTKVQFSEVEMVQNHTLNGIFHPLNITITPVASKGGKILTNGSVAVPYTIPYLGCSYQHEVVADPGYRCVNASFNASVDTGVSSESDNNSIIILPVCGAFEENQTLTANFEPIDLLINSRAEPGGIIDPVLHDYSANFGENLSFKSIADHGYQLANISDNGVDKGPVNPYNITVTENHEIVAHFQSDVLTIKAVAGPGGIIEPNGSMNVTFGSCQCFNITANNGFKISSVIDNGVDKGNISNYCIERVTENHEITANFIKFANVITPLSGPGGSINPSTPQVVPIGDNLTFTIIPDEPCFTIKDVIVDGESKGKISSYPFVNVTKDHTINASFELKKFQIQVNQSRGGEITPAGRHGKVDADCGSTLCFNLTPDKGNVLVDVIVDNTSKGAENKYCFENITANHNISAIFVSPPVPDFEADRTRVPPKYPVYFKDFTKDNPTDWLWDFGDNEISTVREPVHYYADVGNYTVTLTAYNAAAPNGVNKTRTNYIEVTKNPIASFTAKPKGGIVPPNLEIEFNDTSLNIDGVAFGWVFGDGPKGAISRNATHIYTTPGVFEVTHQVEKPFIAKDYAYETITVLQKPEADFIGHPVSGVTPLSVQFEDRSKGFPTSWLWDFGDDVKSYDQNPVHVYSTPGSYNISLSVFSDEGSSVKVKDRFVTVEPEKIPVLPL